MTLHSQTTPKKKIQPEPLFPKFIILESIEDTPLTRLSPFIIQKIISTNISPKTVKHLRNGTIMIETENKKHKLFTKYENFSQLKNKNLPP